MNDKRINIPLPQALKEAAQREAESQGESLSTYTRLALKEKLDRDRVGSPEFIARLDDVTRRLVAEARAL